MSVRLLTLMGSGETSPTMVKTHREVLGRAGGPAAVLDTPYGFQVNADDLSARTQHYFRESVGHPIDVVSYRSAAEQGSVAYEQAMARLRTSAYVFAGPGSPSYALQQWRGSAVPDLLRDKLRSGGCVTFASAAALTLGTATVPVYEVYKAGAAPHWLAGLDLLAEVGICAAVIPHYDNAEGGNHDTRYCYLGEDRLRTMEEQLPADAFIIGIDEHTGVVFDLDAAAATVVGRGGLTVRAAGRSRRWQAGSTVETDELHAQAEALRRRPAGRAGTPDGLAGTGEAAPGVAPEADGTSDAGTAPSLILQAVSDCTARFDAALAARSGTGAVQAILDLEAELHGWAADPTQSDELDQARARLRALIARLGEIADVGIRDPRELVAPYIDTVLAARSSARQERRFDEADELRDRLEDLGVEIHDTADGTEWHLPG